MFSNELSKLSDTELIRLLKKDRADVLEFIYHKYWSRLYIYAYNVLENSEVCKDIVQDIFVDLCVKKKSIEALSPYLFQAVKFQIFNHFRKNKSRNEYIDNIDHQNITNNTEEQIDYSDLENMIDEALGQLPARCHQIFRLSRMEGLTNKQIAEKLDISLQTVKNQITKALGCLRPILKNTFLTLILLNL